MTSMTGDIVNRVRRLPKPTRSAQALQPLFEAVSNAIHAVEDRFEKQAITAGRVEVAIQDLKNHAKVHIRVSDNGVGLTKNRYEAFGTTDTNFKVERGGKGIGRLLWLDAFESIDVISVFEEGGKRNRRFFSFELSQQDQLTREKTDLVSNETDTGTHINFGGIRGAAYRKTFPVKAGNLVKHFGSHFFSDFILGQTPQIVLTVDGESYTYPSEILSLLHKKFDVLDIPSEDHGDLKLASFVCAKAASADFDGQHQLHYIANGRTVTTRKIDGLIGIGRLGPEGEYVYHGCVSGEFLDERVNQERTQFTFDESILDDIAKECSKAIRESVLVEEVATFDRGRLKTMDEFVAEYPSFHFEKSEDLLNKTPKNAIKAEDFARALIPLRIRRDNERKEKIQKIVSMLASDVPIPADFAKAVRDAASAVQAEEQRQLTEYVLRRKMVLEVLDVLLKRIREKNTGDDDHHLESTLHQFICPMRVRGDDPSKIESSDHDLWIIDERFCFTRYFASDVPFQTLIEESKNGERPDLLIFDRLHGLSLEGEEPLQRVLLVEFKRPGRERYEERYTPESQISRYLHELRGKRIENYDRDSIRIADDCIFYCYIVADIVGDLDIVTSSWPTTSNGRGRWTELAGKYRGSIEIIEWKDLITDARARNLGFMDAAGVTKAKPAGAA